MDLISVIMPAYNASRFIREAVESILMQDDPCFELILVDDCSTDDTGMICAEYAHRDPRVRVLRTQVNSGIAGALNVGLAAARGALIARMDADDISLLSRLSQQRAYLQDHQSIALCGMAIETMRFDGSPQRRVDTAIDSDRIERLAAWCSPVAHPTWMFRRELIDVIGNYRDVAPAEDYDFLLRTLAAGYKVANLADVGLRYRESGTALRNGLMQRKAFNYVRRINRRQEEYSRDSFLASTSSSLLATKMHQLSARMLVLAGEWNSIRQPLAIFPLVTAMLLSPYQAQFVFRSVIVKWILKRSSSHG